MIQSIVLLLVANTFIPYVPVPATILFPLPITQILMQAPSALESMNLSRTYKPEEFKQAFKTSLRVHHPDHGGGQQVFQQIQGLKKIMQKEINYYDLYNLTDADISQTGMKLEQAVQIKKYTYYVQTGIFYFITILYILAFTLDNDIKTPRNLMLLLTVVFAAYQLFIHEYPKQPTLIDLFYNKLPLFTQRKFMKRTLIVWIALIRSYYDKKKTEERILLDELKQQRPEEEYRDILQRLKVINLGKLEEKQKYEKSFGFKIRNWISKGISIVFILLIIKNMIPGLNML